MFFIAISVETCGLTFHEDHFPMPLKATKRPKKFIDWWKNITKVSNQDTSSSQLHCMKNRY
ncbi:hypothetical protein BpHYR1_038360 [Brachionus plicatilis]|uniref:Uncharacterized protein n=1 Tax=Brachionus plicatilis TaxID=10195 RepID=A0A3M7R2U7_BRAPC|nr:hypothetical protein BpHYR1_038360 [Brachionus plicatilis]